MTKRPATGSRKSPPGRLRIVAGNWRSRLLQIADVPGLRPTSERVRETLFNWLEPRIEGARCLDLFAGTGALGFEALSRGATSVVFVDNSPQAVRAIERSVEVLDAEGTTIWCGNAEDYLLKAHPEPFDIVFLDPPFAAEMLEELCRLIDKQDILAADARVYLEQDGAYQAPQLPAGWVMLKNKKAGNVGYSLVKRSA